MEKQTTIPEYYRVFLSGACLCQEMTGTSDDPACYAQISATLTLEQANLLRWRAEGRAWKAICWDLGVSRSTAVRRHRDAELVLLWRLAGGEPEVERLPRRAFRQVVMARLGLA